MDSAEIIYATVEEVIGKTGKINIALRLHWMQAQEEVLHKLRLASSVFKTELSSEMWKAQLERATSSLCSNPNVKPEDSDEQTWYLVMTDVLSIRDY